MAIPRSTSISSAVPQRKGIKGIAAGNGSRLLFALFILYQREGGEKQQISFLLNHTLIQYARFATRWPESALMLWIPS